MRTRTWLHVRSTLNILCLSFTSYQAPPRSQSRLHLTSFTSATFPCCHQYLVRRTFTCDNTGDFGEKALDCSDGHTPCLVILHLCNDVFNLKEIKERKCYCISQSNCKWYLYKQPNVGTWMLTRDTRKGLCCVNIVEGSAMGLVLGMQRPGGYIMSKKSKSMVCKNKAVPPVQ